MNLRKEQVLFVAAVLLAAWIWQRRDDTAIVTTARPGALEWTGIPPAPVVLADPEGAIAAPAKDLFREPTEAEPLPPAPLDFPPLAPLPVVAPPLDPGQEAMAFDQLRMPGGEPTFHDLSKGGEEGEEPVDDGTAVEESAPQSGSSDIPVEVLRQRFDRLFVRNQREPWYGRILADNKVELATAAVISQPVEFETVSRKDGNVISTQTFEADDITDIELADNLENRIALKKLELSDAQESIPARVEFIRVLLDEARSQPSAYEEAESQARRITELSPSATELGYRWIARVLRAQGDIGREWEFYRSLEGEIAESSFRYRAQGEFEARLGLWEDAEAHLRRAVEIAPNDARSLAALARYLLDRGRAIEALPFAERASRTANQVVEEDDRFRVLRVPVAVHLALGQLDPALEALDRTRGLGQEAEHAFLSGAVHYARGSLDEAAASFERAAADVTDLEPVLGLGLVGIRRGQWDAAHAALMRVVDGAPLLRGRALSALGLLYERTGNQGPAMEALERAERIDPTDPYSLYMLGRAQRLEGRYDEAIETLKRALAERDDLIEALAEIARALIEKADESPDEAADLQVRAARYIERVVELDQRRAKFVPYLEAQGLVLASIGDVNLAREAFRAGVDQGSDFSELGLALLDYRQKRVRDARDRLAAIASDPARAQETREFARTTLARIDEHATKEQVRDSFERDQLGGLWLTQGALEPFVENGRLVFRGTSGRISSEESVARRQLRAGDFLRAEVTMQVLGDKESTQFAGLRLVPEGGRQDFEVSVAMQRQRPEFYLKDGRPQDGEADEPVPIDDLGQIDFSKPQRLVIEVAPNAEGNRLSLTILWNGRQVAHRDALRTLNANASWTLNVDLMVRGTVHVAFDDFRLVRMQETR